MKKFIFFQLRKKQRFRTVEHYSIHLVCSRFFLLIKLHIIMSSSTIKKKQLLFCRLFVAFNNNNKNEGTHEDLWDFLKLQFFWNACGFAHTIAIGIVFFWISQSFSSIYTTKGQLHLVRAFTRQQSPFQEVIVIRLCWNVSFGQFFDN